MGMTIWRWGACVAVICVVIGAVLLPFPTATPQSWASNAPPVLTLEIGKLTDAAARAQSAVRGYRSLQALDRWTVARATSDTTPIRVETSVPALVAAAARTVVAEQWAALGPRASAARGCRTAGRTRAHARRGDRRQSGQRKREACDAGA